MKKRVAIWNRAKNGSHIKAIKFYCLQNDYEIVDIFDFKDISTGLLKEHPEYRRYREAVTNKSFDILIALDPSRISRSVKELFEEIDHLDKNQISFVSINQGINTKTPHSKMLFTLLKVLSEFENNQIKENVHENTK